MAALTPDQINARIETSFDMASSLFRRYGDLQQHEKPLYREEARHALNLGLKQILGKALTEYLARAKLTRQRYRYKEFVGPETEEHVIPLGVMIEFLARHPQIGWFPQKLGDFF